MLKQLKQAVLHASGRVRLLDSVARSEWRRRRLLILCYHSVAADEEHRWRRPLFFTCEEFAERLALLQRARVNVLSLTEALVRLRLGTLPARATVLTFDDGTADFATVVWPLLKRYGYPATVYLTTYYSEKQLPVFPLMCSYLLWKARDRSIAPIPELGVREPLVLSDAAARERLATALVDDARRQSLSAKATNDRLPKLAGHLGVDYDTLLRRRVLQLMTPDETRQVAADGADVQLHTHRHIAPLDRERFEREIVENRQRLEGLTGRRADHFCYPSGICHPEFLGWLDAHRIRSATTCRPALATAETNPLLLPRVVDTVGLQPIELEGWLTGVSQFFPQRGALAG